MLPQQIHVGQALHGLASYLDVPVIENDLLVTEDRQHCSPNTKPPSAFCLRQDTQKVKIRLKHKCKVSNVFFFG